MPTTHHQEDRMTAKPPTRRQLAYLRVLADRAGQTFSYPRTQAHASREIQRLKNTPASAPLERAIERFGDPRTRENAEDTIDIVGLELLDTAGSDRSRAPSPPAPQQVPPPRTRSTPVRASSSPGTQSVKASGSSSDSGSTTRPYWSTCPQARTAGSTWSSATSTRTATVHCGH
jgi:hypothetical protein